MKKQPKQSPPSPERAFKIKDCALITRMAGIASALNLRELRERIADCPLESLYHHFCETALRASFDDPEFRNDFAVWAARHQGDRVLAERLGILNPYAFDTLGGLREEMLDILDERLAERHASSWTPASEEFRFMQAATVVFDTGRTMESVHDLIEAMPQLSRSAIYYHFVEARRRVPGRSDDFSAWLANFGAEAEGLRRSFAHIDFYFLNLPELKTALVEAVRLSRERTGS